MVPGWMRLLVGAAIAAAPSGLAAAELVIVNSSGKAIHELYIAPRGDRTWGPDRLRGKQPAMIAGGQTMTVADLAPGAYQLMLVDADGAECEIESVDLMVSYRLDLTSRALRECTSSH